MVYRYTSRTKRLDQTFLNERLQGALAYDRIAGYFSSSILEIAGEAIEGMQGTVRVICNSDMEIDDVKTASAAVNAMRREWCEAKPEQEYANIPERLKKLYDLVKNSKLIIKVVPNKVFGLIHGKAGVITLSNGNKTAFIGSINETYAAWRLNYEMLWEDDSKEAVDWVQDEFNYFWNSPYAVPISDFVIKDIKRIADRKIITSVDEWKDNPEPASTVIESPVYRQEFGLWEHQKYFVNLAFNDHKKSYGARFVLADMVGLGKTVQLALSAQLMALYGDKPVLVIAPKTLLWQWQDELNTLLDMPSAVWTGKEWVDENGVKYPSFGDSSIKKCPRRVGIISQGLITANSDCIYYLLGMKYECVIVDEAHRARRKKFDPKKDEGRLTTANCNNLLKFLIDISGQTKSMLLATATPVQLHPIEAWDLLNVLSQANDSVLGSNLSMWRKHPLNGIGLIMGEETLDRFDRNHVDWVRNPFPPASEGEMTFGRIRSQLGMAEDEFVIKPDDINRLRPPEQRRFGSIIDDDFVEGHNPFIRHIVRRSREYLENTINPETGEPYLKAVKVKLMGEDDDEAIVLPTYLQEAYGYAEEFCEMLQKRVKGGGFLKSLLLKRVGSTMIAGRSTAEEMLQNWGGILDEEDYEDEDTSDDASVHSDIKNITEEERDCLIKFVDTLESHKGEDPKYLLLKKILIDDNWIERGCIVFSQFFDSAFWVANSLSKDLPNERIGLYAGGDKSGIIKDGIYEKCAKEDIKKMVKRRELRILIGTDAASEGLNLQTLGSLINLDLPWNPTRLEQRKGRIQRIGQVFDEVLIYNMRYKGSVEDRVHYLLSERLGNIHGMFGQLPDVLQDVWIDVALNDIEEAKRRIDEIPKQHPFELRYHVNVGKVDWESCVNVLDGKEKRKYLMSGWR